LCHWRSGSDHSARSVAIPWSVVSRALWPRCHRRHCAGTGRSGVAGIALTASTGECTLTADPIIVARGVTRRLGGLVALDGIDLDVPQGIVQAIIGPNGSGKTTLLNALSGASHADTGSIRVGGQEIFRLKPHRIARLGLARTFQNIRIFDNLSVIENVKVAAACNNPTSLFNILTANARHRLSETDIDRNARE